MTQFTPQWNCPRCNAPNSAAARFCSNCGLPFQNSNTATAQSAFNPSLQQGGSMPLPPTQEVWRQPSTQYSDLPDAYPLYPSPAADPYASVQDQVPPPPDYLNPYPVLEEKKQPPLLSRRNLLLGGVAAVLAAGTGFYFFSRASSNTIPVTFLYSTEKAPWLTAAIQAFKRSNSNTLNNKTIDIQPVQPDGLGSVESLSGILNGQYQPVAWSPASSLELNRLNYKWQQAKGTQIISTSQQFQAQSLVKSPLVLLSWQQRAQKLLAHYHKATLDWRTLHSAFQANSWADVGGSLDWGRAKFGQTIPRKSNSGLITITLIAYDYYSEPRSLTRDQVNPSSKYWGYLDVFEQAVNGGFGCSSGTYLDKVIGGGPAQADVIATYENLALTSQLPGQSLLIYYPSPNILSDHPFAVLQGDWATDEQSQAALQFRDFLLGKQQQLMALSSYGFRPGSDTLGISLQDSNVPGGNPFVRYAGLFPNHRPDPVQDLAKVPGGDVVDALITGWNTRYPNNSINTLDCQNPN